MFVDLAESRKEIDGIDAEIVKLFEQRMKVAANVADYKLATGKAVFDKEREMDKIKNLKGMAESEFNAKCIAELFTQIMAMSRKFQYQRLEERETDSKLEPYELTDGINKEGVKVVYQGVPGAYSHEAMINYFGRDVDNFNVGTFREAMDAVRKGRADYAVIPIDNSSAGMVNDTYDLLQEFNNYIVAETYVQIRHCLLACPRTELEDIKTVYSHPQGLAQCGQYLDKHPEWEQRESLNTAIAAKKVAEDKDNTQAAIGSANCAEEYGLVVLEEGINTAEANTTRFVIVARERRFVRNAGKVSICFEIQHESGSLYNAISHIMFNGLNMTKIESRPIPEHNWEFRFFVDFEGNLADAGVRNALRGIAEESNYLRLLGNY